MPPGGKSCQRKNNQPEYFRSNCQFIRNRGQRKCLKCNMWMQSLKSRIREAMGSLRVRHDCATSLSLFTFTHWRRKWQPTPVFLPGETWGWGSLIGCHLWGHAESDMTEGLSSSSKDKRHSCKVEKRDGVNVRFRILKYMSNKVWTYSNKVIKK